MSAILFAGGILAGPANIDRQHVTLASEAECLYWETKLGAQRGAIGDAIAAVGDQPNMVHAWLMARHAPPPDPARPGRSP
jgi:hypothetical protein